MLQSIFLRHELAWIAKRAGAIIGLFVCFVAALALKHFSENIEIALTISAFVFVHLWLLTWLTFRIRITHNHDETLSLQICWRESGKLLIHCTVRS